ncbi:unnamed protein product [Rhizoctonia solani]|uniref:Uncharacterized protein n=1 Tax=Rhizoctonia solani TaxID=456999 RepID=A0A8H3G9R4_9AGAM|nr:unnamed protein product [Rhizoctonia solani]
MVCHRHKYPVRVLPNDVVYNPPALPNYIQVELKPVTGPPSNEDIASVHTALRISESYVNVPAIFDPDVHAQLSQHLFDIQFARHVQRSAIKQPSSVLSASQNLTIPENVDTNNKRDTHIPPQAAFGPTEAQHAMPEQPSTSQGGTSHRDQNQNHEPCRTDGLMLEIKNIGDTLKNMNRVLIGSQNSLARGFNSSSIRCDWKGSILGFDLGAHSLINEHGDVPEAHDLPTFKYSSGSASFPVNDLTGNVLARYLQFYGIGGEVLAEGNVPRIKPGMTEDAKRLLSERLFLNRQ